MNDDPFRLDRLALARNLARASADYDRHAVLGAEVRAEMLRRLELLSFEPGVVLDLGSATGHGARALRERWRRAQVLAVDLSPGMLRASAARFSWRKRFERLRADGEQLPLKSGSVDLVYSNLMLPFAVDLDAQLREVRRVLAPRGYFTFSTLGPDTLLELRAAFAARDCAPHVHRFLDLHDIGDALLRAGFADPVMDVDRYTLTYPTFDAVLAELRGLGAQNALAARSRGLAGRARKAALAAAYESFRNGDRRLPASVEVVYGQAWCPGATPPIRGRRGEVVVPIGSLGRRR